MDSQDSNNIEQPQTPATDVPTESQAPAAPAQSMLVVLAKNISTVRATVTFLERRGFAAKIVPSLNEAVELFSKKEANMLLLSVNFPHPKVEMLPVLMNQSFNIETILYAEDSDRKTSNRLNNAKTKHVLFGPVSGPVVMMKIRQIDRELNGTGEDEAVAGGARNSGAKADENDIKVGGKKSSTDDTVVLNGKADSEKKVALDTLMKTLTEEEAAVEADGLARSGETYIQKGQRSKMKSEVEEGGDADSNSSISAQAQDLRRGLDRGLTAAPPGAKPRLISPSHFKRPLSDVSSVEAVLDFMDDDAASMRMLEEAVELAAQSADDATFDALREDLEALAAMQAAQQAATDAEQAAKDEAEKQAAQVADEKAKHEAKASQAAVESGPLSGSEDEKSEAKIQTEKPNDSSSEPALDHSAFASATDLQQAPQVEAEVAAVPVPLTDEEIVQVCLKEALAIVAGAPTERLYQLSKYTSAALVTLRTSTLSCAFVVSLAESKQTAGELFHRIEIAFFSLMRDRGMEFENDQTYSILLDNMTITQRAFEASEFVVVSRSADVEMGVAKVYVSNPVAKMEPYEENMLMVDLHDIPADEPVTFNVFLHLKRNQKYIRYLKLGASLSNPQIQRLDQRNAQMLVEQKESEAYRRHYAASSIQPRRRVS